LYLSALVELGLVLLLVNVLVNTLARWLIWRVGRVRKSSMFASLRRSAALRKTPHEPTPASTERRRIAGRNTLTWWLNQLMTLVLGMALIITVGSLFLILS